MSKQAEAGAIRIDKLERIEESQARKKGLEPSEIYPGMRVTAYAIGADGGHGLKKMTVLAKYTHTVLCETDNGLLTLALDLKAPVPEIYGKIERGTDGLLRTTKAQRTGCPMCGFGVHLETRPHRFDRLKERNPKYWDFLMYHAVKDESGEYGWGRVLDYLEIEWENEPGQIKGQMNIFDFITE